MKIKLLVTVFALFFLWSCSTTMEYTWTKENFQGKKFDKVLVMAITRNLESRTLFEYTAVEYLKESGVNAMNSINVFTPVEKFEDLNEKEIESRIKNGGYDAVLITSLIDVNTRDVRVVQSGPYYPFAYDYGYGYSYWGFIYGNYSHMYMPEYYREEKNYVLETRLYDVNEGDQKEAIVWAGQSSLTDPSSADSASKQFTKKLVKTLIETGKIK